MIVFSPTAEARGFSYVGTSMDACASGGVYSTYKMCEMIVFSPTAEARGFSYVGTSVDACASGGSQRLQLCRHKRGRLRQWGNTKERIKYAKRAYIES